jgi:hypothetical protein
MAHVVFVSNLIAHDFDLDRPQRTEEEDGLLDQSLQELGLDQDEIQSLARRMLERAGVIEDGAS